MTLLRPLISLLAISAAVSFNLISISAEAEASDHIISASSCKAASASDSEMLRWRENGLANVAGDGIGIVCPISFDRVNDSAEQNHDVLKITVSFVNGLAESHRQVVCILYGYDATAQTNREEIEIPLNTELGSLTSYSFTVPISVDSQVNTFNLWCSLPANTSLSAIHTSSFSGWFEHGQPASILLGGIGFNETGGGLLFNHPKGIATDGQRLFLCDGNNNRVLIWNSLPKGNEMPDLVLGQSDFDQLEPGSGLDNLNWPVSVSTDGERLLVADTYNHRILVWDQIPTKNGQAADWAITGFPDGAQLPISPDKTRFVWPWGVWTDGEKLVVTSTSESTRGGIAARGGWVLVWNTFPENSDQAADIILTGSGKMGTPRTITSDGKRLMIGDHNAVGEISKMGSWVWNTFPQEDEQPPDFFLTEEPPTIWLQGAISDSDQLVAMGNTLYVWNNFPKSEADAANIALNGFRLGLRSGDGSDAILIEEELVLSDYNGNRLLGFSAVPESAETVPDYVVGSDSLSVNTLDANYFITNPEPATNGKQFYVASAFDQVLHGWNSLPVATAQSPDFSFDTTDGAATVILHNDYLILPGKQGSLDIWSGLPDAARDPDIVAKQDFGGASFSGFLDGCSDGVRVYLLDDRGTLSAWDGLPTDFEEPVFQLTFEELSPSKVSCSESYVALTIGGKILMCPKLLLPNSGACTSVTSEVFSQNLSSTLFTESGFFVADRGNNQVHAWKAIEDFVASRDPDLLLGASTYADITPETRSDALFWPATLAFDGRRLWVGEYKFSGRLLGYHKLY